MTLPSNTGVSKAEFLETLAKYEVERQKRQRDDGLAQYIDAGKSDKFKHYGEDPWIEYDNTLRQQPPPPVANGDHKRLVILGAGYGAMTFAIRFIEAGVFKAEDIIFVDQAGGFGGVWYWNRYPGLMCDVRSSVYLPLLEETSYMPKDRYSYGPELKEYAEILASKWNLQSQGLWQSTLSHSRWDEKSNEWVHTIIRKVNGKEETMTIRSDYYLLISGVLSRPKLPRIPGLSEFQGHMFHTARWDFGYTGGSPSDFDMIKLRNKRVAYLGTGATAVQAIPELAKWCQKLYVIQRTPASVAERGQAPTDPGEWAKATSYKGWQRAQRDNMARWISNEPDIEEDLIQDAWTSFPSYSGLVGGPAAAELTEASVKDYIADLLQLDHPRQAGIRARVDDIVQDTETAESLKPWYPGYCKRPCFHDEYLQSFNLANVELVDTGGRGVDKLTPTGLVAGSKKIDIDLLILGTGFEPWTAGSPAHRANVTITGRDGLDMDEKWRAGIGTLHGCFTRGFPNLILPGLTQAGASVNYCHMTDVAAEHVAHILTEAAKRAKAGHKVLVEPTAEGEEVWTMKIVRGAYALGGLSICTPSYATNEGALTKQKSPEEQLKLARGSIFPTGFPSYSNYLKEWTSTGLLPGVDIRVVE
ncbi:cyclohexanone monooxygenase [Fusarium acutatum]|uniref:Cyclohexanone monooxygenase n=1 Tax=Fusarium acutatum TaxID=78861 RepID=A0A8H4NK26_9HYPO|nr:cyclohexanone monooxygenase [Fusarium acutatum]